MKRIFSCKKTSSSIDQSMYSHRREACFIPQSIKKSKTRALRQQMLVQTN